GRRQTRTDAVLAMFGGNRLPRDFATTGTTTGVALVLDDLGPHRRQVSYLEARRLGIVRSRLSRQGVMAVAAVTGHVDLPTRDPFRRQHLLHGRPLVPPSPPASPR